MDLGNCSGKIYLPQTCVHYVYTLVSLLFQSLQRVSRPYRAFKYEMAITQMYSIIVSLMSSKGAIQVFEVRKRGWGRVKCARGSVIMIMMMMQISQHVVETSQLILIMDPLIRKTSPYPGDKSRIPPGSKYVVLLSGSRFPLAHPLNSKFCLGL